MKEIAAGLLMLLVSAGCFAVLVWIWRTTE